MAITNEGQSADSPTATPEPGQESESLTDKVIAAAEEETAEPGAGEESPEESAESPAAEEAEEKPLPYDQDPKWLAARAAEKRLNDIMEKHDVSSHEELEELFESESGLRSVIGERDAAKLIEDADTLAQYREYWALQELQRKEDQESPEQTIERQKTEIAELDGKIQRRDADQQAVEESASVIQAFNDEITRQAESVEGLPENQRRFLSTFLGVDNPIDEVDASDLKAVRSVTKENIDQFMSFVKEVEQTAIDHYAAGKSSLAPTKPTTETSTPASAEVKSDRLVPITDDDTTESGFGKAKEVLLEMFKKASGA